MLFMFLICYTGLGYGQVPRGLLNTAVWLKGVVEGDGGGEAWQGRGMSLTPGPTLGDEVASGLQEWEEDRWRQRR